MRTTSNALEAIADIKREFQLDPLAARLSAAEALLRDDKVSVAVVGQFKAGKSSFLNSLLTKPLLPTSVLPATAVITRVEYGTAEVAQITYTNTQVEQVRIEKLADFVTEEGNPGNSRQVMIADLYTPLLSDFPNIRLVDTPGLGSVFTHNTETTMEWMPNLSAAIVAVSVERPLSEEDLRLVHAALEGAPRVCILLTKVDLLTAEELNEVIEYVTRIANARSPTALDVYPFSARIDTARWLVPIKNCFLQQLSSNCLEEKTKAVGHKLSSLLGACREYLCIGLNSAERSATDRARLRRVVLDEQTNLRLILEELDLTARSLKEKTRDNFKREFFKLKAVVLQSLLTSFEENYSTWHGSLSSLEADYTNWLHEILNKELALLSNDADAVAATLVEESESRFRRVLDSIWNRIRRELINEMGLSISAVAWEPLPPRLERVPTHVGRTFMFSWSVISWMIPHYLVSKIFRRHAAGLLPGVVETNMSRLANDWARLVDMKITELRDSASKWIESELATIDRLLSQQSDTEGAFRQALARLEEVA